MKKWRITGEQSILKKFRLWFLGFDNYRRRSNLNYESYLSLEDGNNMLFRRVSKVPAHYEMSQPRKHSTIYDVAFSVFRKGRELTLNTIKYQQMHVMQCTLSLQ